MFAFGPIGRMTMLRSLRDGELDVVPWLVKANDEIHDDCILIAVMQGSEMVSVSLHVAVEPKNEEPN